jgi:GTP pyrophosphokinase
MRDPVLRSRWVPVTWSAEESSPFQTTLEIDAEDRDGLWLDVASVLSAAKVKVTELAGREMPAGRARILATFEVRNVSELEAIRGKIRQIAGVVEVRRGQH